MKEATGEVSMTVITIVLVGIVLTIAMVLFGKDGSPGRDWINTMFFNLTDAADDATDDATR